MFYTTVASEQFERLGTEARLEGSLSGPRTLTLFSQEHKIEKKFKIDFDKQHK